MKASRSRPRPRQPPNRQAPARDKALGRVDVWIALGLAVLTVAVFAALRHADFVSLDDSEMVTDNAHVKAGLSLANLVWAFRPYFHFWIPATYLSLMLDVELHGVDPGWMHVTNVALHVACTLILFGLLADATRARWPSAFVAALFAVHPLHVESVAWITERKDVLSTLFWWLGMWGYVAYIRRPSWQRYAMVLACFVVGVMAKPMVVTMPLTLLLFDVWPLRRVDLNNTAIAPWVRLVTEKWPFLALAAAGGLVAFVAEGTAVASVSTFPLSLRVVNAVASCAEYLGKTVWPTHLSVFYPYDATLPVGLVVMSALVLLGFTVAALRAIRSHPYITMGWVWYLVTVAPVSGLVQVGIHRMADRYTYVPLVGIFIAVAWGVPALLAKWPAVRTVLGLSAAGIVLAFAIASRGEVERWMNSLALWESAVTAMPDNFFAQENLGSVLISQGRFDEAVVHLRRAVALDPNFPDSQYNLGVALMKLGQFDEAIALYQRAVDSRPDFAEAHHNLGIMLFLRGRIDDAIEHYRRALRLEPDWADVYVSLGAALAAQGHTDDAIQAFQDALRRQPALPLAHYRIGLAYASAGKVSEAVASYREALRQNPDFVEAHSDLGLALLRQGNNAAATAEYREAIRLRPGFEAAHFNLGVAEASAGHVQEAIKEFNTVLQINPGNSQARQALASISRR